MPPICDGWFLTKEANYKLDKINCNSKSGQQKVYGIVLIVIFIVLALLHYFYPGSSEVAGSDLQPVRKYISNQSGAPLEVYSGTISKISSTSITLSNGAKSKEFSISKEHPARYANLNHQPIEPKIGDNATSLFFIEAPSKEKYVTRVDINTLSRK